jgi:ribosomal protein S8
MSSSRCCSSSYQSKRNQRNNNKDARLSYDVRRCKSSSSCLASPIFLFIVCWCYCCALVPHPCDGFQHQSPSSLTGTLMRCSINQRRSSAYSSSVLFYQNEEAARRRENNNNSNSNNLNSRNAPTAFTTAAIDASINNEYDRDAEFYKRRNQEYYNSMSNTNDSIMNVMSSEEYYTNSNYDRNTKNNRYYYDYYKRDEREPVEETLNEVIKTSRSSFKNVESLTLGLLSRRPVVALGLFLMSLGLAAYLTGFFILDGYIDNWNPAENDQVPYWDEPDIHTIMRRQ